MGGVENLWKYESTNKSNKVYTSTHHRISTNGFTIPVTSPDKSVVNFSRSCVILWSASIFLLDMWKTYKYIWHELKLLILDATNSTQEIDISFNKWKTILKNALSLSEKIAACNLHKQNVPFNTDSWLIIQVINLFYNAFRANKLSTLLLLCIQIKGQQQGTNLSIWDPITL